MSHSSLPLETISETALGTAFCRAMETERADAHFLDPFAHLLAGTRGQQVIRTLGGSNSAIWPVVVRTYIIDELIRRHAKKVDMVLNLAAGLDTRPYRLPLPPQLRWVEVDLPEVLAYKQAKLHHVRPVCALETVPLDLREVAARTELLARVRVEANQVLVITEGLLIYLTLDQARSLAQDLHDQPQVQGWITDWVSPFVLKLQQRAWHQAADTIKLQSAARRAEQLFQPYGWTVAEFHSLWQVAHSLNRGIWLGPLLQRVPALEAGVTLLKRT
jgi:methyltransferase (TIGR00027 family)